MGANQPEKVSGISVQQLSRRVQVVVTEALHTLDKVRAIDPAGQGEVESLRSVVWSDLTGLESEFSREEGPRAALLERFFNHLLSNGDYIGEIESLAEALLGGAPPPSQPLPDSPVAGLFRLHGALTEVRRQWQELAAPQATGQPAAPPVVPAPVRREAGAPQAISRPVAPPVAAPPVRSEDAVKTADDYFDEMAPPARQEGAAPPASRSRALAERPSSPPPFGRQGGPERFLGDLGFGGFNAPARGADAESPRPRVLVSFVTVFVILALMGVGVIYLGLNGNSQANTGIVPSAVPTFSLTIPTSAPQPTPTLSSAAPQLEVTGNPLIVPCPGKGSSGFVLKNTGGQRLNWSATVKRAGASAQPVTLNPTSGFLFGPPNSGTDAVTVSVTATVGDIDGTITIISNAAGPVVITYHIHGC